MLYTYLQRTRLLLADMNFVKVSDFDLADYVNQGRLQVAGQGRCVRVYQDLPLIGGQQGYPFTRATGLASGIGWIYHIRQAWIQIPGVAGQILLYARPFEWFALYELNSFAPRQGQPKRWAQFGQGVTGSIFLAPIPDLPYNLLIDALGVPSPLIDDTTVEAIPDLWTLPVPFYAAWYALQTALQYDAADKMKQNFLEQMAFARAAANPDLLSENWSQAADPEQANRLAVQPARAA